MEIFAGTLIDGTGAPPLHDVTLVTNGDRVGEVRRGLAGRAEDGSIDARHLTVLPGLINCHEHLSLKARRGSLAEMMRESQATLALQAAQSARWDISQGITTVRSTGDKDYVDVAMSRAVTAGICIGPRVIAAGPPLVMTGGHGYPMGHEVDGPDAMRRAVRDHFKNGSAFIKVISSGGLAQTRPGEGTMEIEFGVEELRAAAEVAHRAERRVAAHAHGPEAIENCLDAGIDSVEHGTLLTSQLAARMVKQGTYLVPTLSQIHRFALRGVELGKPKSYQDAARAILDDTMKCFRTAIAEGVKFVTGTDGVGDLVEEIEIFVQAGVTPVQAIHAATGRAAELLDVPSGVLAPGRNADVVVVEGDPLQDIKALRNVRYVVQGGRIVWSGPHD